VELEDTSRDYNARAMPIEAPGRVCPHGSSAVRPAPFGRAPASRSPSRALRAAVASPALVAAVELFAGAAPPIERTIADLGGRPVTIEVTAGEVRVAGWDRPGVEAAIEPMDRGDDPGALVAGIEETAESVRVRAVQPDGRREGARRASVTVRVPSSATLARVELFEGRLQLEGLRGSIQGTVEQGPIVGSRLAGVVRLETSAGDITIDGADLTAPGLLRLRTFNGNITLHLVRPPPDARVLALTLNGQIRSDLPLSARPGFGPRFREGVFGTGEPLVSLDAVRGDITITVQNPDRPRP
jgi:hypothetical protein